MWEHRRLNEDGWSVAADGTGLQGGMNGAMTRESGERQGARIACATLGKDGGRTGELGRRGETLVAFWKPSAMFGGGRSKDGGEGAGVTNTKARHRRRSMSTSMGWAAAEGGAT